MLGRVRTASPWLLFGASLAAVVLGSVLFLRNRQVPGTGRFFDPVMPGVGLAYPAVGAFILSRRPSNRIGWLYCTGALLGVAFMVEQYAVHALLAEPGSLPGGTWAAWLAGWLRIPGHLLPWTLVLLLYPDGRPPGPRWRALAPVAATAVAAATALAAFAPAGVDSPALRNPVTLDIVPRLSGALQAVCVLGFGPLCLAALLVRFRRTRGSPRAQLRPFVAAATVVVLVPLSAAVAVEAGLPLSMGAYQAVGLVALLGLPTATMFAIIRYRLYGLSVHADLLVNRLVVYGSLLVVAITLYWMIVGTLAALISGDPGLGPALVAVIVVATVGHQLRKRVQAMVDRLLYRQRNYDYRVLSALGERLQSTLSPDAVLPAVVETVATALKLPHVAIRVGSDGDATMTAAYGEARQSSVVLPLVYQREVVGRLEVAPRSPEEPFDAADRRLLDDLAGQVAVLAYALRLAADLQRSRELLVNAQAEERRRLRRDLHDGLQPALSGVSLGLEAVRNLMGADSPVEELLVRLKDELETAVADLRRLVYDLRPPALDELGLVGALRQQAARFALSPDAPEVVVEAPAGLGALPAAAEVAAYRIAQEALENVRKHARAQSATVVVAHDDGHLELVVLDDGVGLAPGEHLGVGLVAMRERAAELGGTCSVEPGPERGTCVRARLPVGAGR